MLTRAAVFFTLLCVAPGAAGAAEYPFAVPDWFEANRVQAHSEHGLELALKLTPEAHAAAIRRLGAEVLTRVYLTRDEGAWWQSAVGEIHPLIGQREFAAEISRAVHAEGMKVIAYHRHMSDAAMQEAHPDWVCRHPDGSPMLEPRGRTKTIFVLCMNSPYREYIKTRLVELADRGVDGIYFDNRHMPDVCACKFCREGFRRERGHAMDLDAPVGSPAYLEAVDFVNRSMVRGFLEWRRAVREQNPACFFCVKSSQYPMYFSPHIDYRLLEISDTSGTEFHKPFGHRTQVMQGVPDFAEPAFDDQLALGWSIVRDCAGGRPPLMWIPFIRDEQKSLYSAAAAITYGCVAAMNVRIRELPEDGDRAREIFASTFEMGAKVSPYLKHARPLRWAGLHVSERSRNARLPDREATWREVFAPALGAYQVLKEAHLPWGSLSDGDLTPDRLEGTRLLILPWPDELTAGQQAAVRQFEQSGGSVLRLDPTGGWHTNSGKPQQMDKLRRAVEEQAGRAPVRIEGPSAMHAVAYHNPEARRVTVCLTNGFGWFRTARDPKREINDGEVPPPCRGVSVAFCPDFIRPKRVFEAVTDRELHLKTSAEPKRVEVPEFQINACVVAEY